MPLCIFRRVRPGKTQAIKHSVDVNHQDSLIARHHQSHAPTPTRRLHALVRDDKTPRTRGRRGREKCHDPPLGRDPGSGVPSITCSPCMISYDRVRRFVRDCAGAQVIHDRNVVPGNLTGFHSYIHRSADGLSIRTHAVPPCVISGTGHDCRRHPYRLLTTSQPLHRWFWTLDLGGGNDRTGPPRTT